MVSIHVFYEACFGADRLDLLFAALFTLRGRLLHLQNILPFTKYRPDCTNISFALEFPHVDLDLTLPRWSNHNVPPAEPIKKLARVGLLTLEGNYRFFAELREENIEQLTLDLVVSCPSAAKYASLSPNQLFLRCEM